jgi:hypothetical protein
MRRAVITTPFPSIEQTAARLGVSLRRVRELEKLMEPILKKNLLSKRSAVRHRRRAAR